jgi:hypothetical protein
LRNILLGCPAAFSQHSGTPFAMTPLFNAPQVLVKFLAVFIANSVQVLRKEIQVVVQEMDFMRHIAFQSFTSI